MQSKHVSCAISAYREIPKIQGLKATTFSDLIREVDGSTPRMPGMDATSIRNCPARRGGNRGTPAAFARGAVPSVPT